MSRCGFNFIILQMATQLSQYCWSKSLADFLAPVATRVARRLKERKELPQLASDGVRIHYNECCPDRGFPGWVPSRGDAAGSGPQGCAQCPAPILSHSALELIDLFPSHLMAWIPFSSPPSQKHDQSFYIWKMCLFIAGGGLGGGGWGCFLLFFLKKECLYSTMGVILNDMARWGCQALENAPVLAKLLSGWPFLAQRWPWRFCVFFWFF